MKRIAIVAPFLGLVILLFTFNACQKEFSVESGASLGAQGTLYDSTGNCMADSVVGTFYGITPNGGLTQATDTAYVLVKVNVTNAGSFNITSTVQNGIYFSDSGYFTTTGLNTIKLYPTGTPIIPGNFTYSISFDSSTCSFTLATQDSTGRGLNGGGGTVTNPNTSDTAWKFTGPVGSYNGVIDTAYTFDSLGTFNLAIIGHNAGDSIFVIGVTFSGNTIATGTYSSSFDALFGFTTGSGTIIYSAYPGLTGVNIVVNITSYDATTKIITGTFTGTAKDASGNAVSITLGSFTAKVH
jgi:hypothetical protein